MTSIDKRLMSFINETPNAYYCVDNLRQKLIENGFEELYENELWVNLKEDGKYFVTRNDSSIIAFKMSNKKENIGFNIVSVHTDSPSFSIKPNADMFDGNYMKLNVNGYGGMLNYTWLDRPLSLAGRVVTLKDGVYAKQLVNVDKDLLIIPAYLAKGLEFDSVIVYQSDDSRYTKEEKNLFYVACTRAQHELIVYE